MKMFLCVHVSVCTREYTWVWMKKKEDSLISVCGNAVDITTVLQEGERN